MTATQPIITMASAAVVIFFPVRHMSAVWARKTTEIQQLNTTASVEIVRVAFWQLDVDGKRAVYKGNTTSKLSIGCCG